MAKKKESASARPTRFAWKGALKLSLISIPIRVYPATNSGADVSFHQLHRKCHTPIQLKKWCPHCKIELHSEDIVKGYETSKGRMVVVEEEEIAKVRPESTHTIDVSDVVDANTIDPIYIERAYYLAPDGKAAGAAYAVVREALDDKAGVGRLAIHGREYLGAVVPREKALLLYTLRTAGEVRAISGIDGLEYARGTVKVAEVSLARRVLSSFESGRDITSFTDHYQEALREMLASKREEDEVGEAEQPARSTKVVNLMDALRESLSRAQKPSKSKTAKRAAAASSSRARVLAHTAVKRRKAS